MLYAILSKTVWLQRRWHLFKAPTSSKRVSHAGEHPIYVCPGPLKDIMEASEDREQNTGTRYRWKINEVIG